MPATQSEESLPGVNWLKQQSIVDKCVQGYRDIFCERLGVWYGSEKKITRVK